MSEWLFIQQAYVPADIALPKGLPHLCSRGGNRTRTPVRVQDFKSCLSTYFNERFFTYVFRFHIYQFYVSTININKYLKIVAGAGLEPARVITQRFLRPSCLPIPTPGHSWGAIVITPQQHYAAASVSLTLAGRPRLTIPPFTAALSARAAKRA